ncbi:hypothetical protein Pmani_034789 [Petrolisthes manimaculis]|uniref:Uncharacterized protein n=1 Tax=Petrolisthes manimaculis TaxID=1843537 RepID=A0AAE1NLT3_9EUCA|nr:hypothetical protein Pmani_034789 [Petrolisthes manimaculis]
MRGRRASPAADEGQYLSRHGDNTPTLPNTTHLINTSPLVSANDASSLISGCGFTLYTPTLFHLFSFS